MGLYDVIGDITNAQNQKTATGDNRIWGVVVGTVTSNYAESMLGRVCVEIPTRGQDEGDNILQWARVAMNSFGTDWGTYFLPEVGDEVLLVFEQGNIEKPYIIGCIPKDKSNVLNNHANEKNTNKTITTKHGSQITFFDSGDEEKGKDGQLDKITIQTATKDKYEMIELDNENQKISITNKEKDTSIIMETDKDSKGKITVKASKKIEMYVGDKIKVYMDGDQGKVSIEAASLEFQSTEKNAVIKAANQIELTGNAGVKLSGPKINVASDGMLTLQGTPIQLK